MGAVAVGPPLSFDAFVAAHRALIFGRARQLCRRHLDADDLVQEALLRAFRGYSTMRDPTRGRAWLLSILTRTFVDHLRSRHAEPPSDPIEEIEPAAPAPEKRPRWEEIDGAVLAAAVERLPDDVRQCYRMHALEQRDYRDIAEALGIPKATVGTRLLRARRKLKEMLTRELGAEEE